MIPLRYLRVCPDGYTEWQCPRCGCVYADTRPGSDIGCFCDEPGCQSCDCAVAHGPAHERNPDGPYPLLSLWR
jgi:hypothetical protein